MELYIAAVTDRGCLRKHNEDRILVGSDLLKDGTKKFPTVRLEKGSSYIVAIADGMGGHQAGEVAAEMVLELLSQKVLSLPFGLTTEEMENQLNQWALKTHSRLLEEEERDPAKSGMGTTLVALLFYDDAVYYLNVGDSRLYRFRNGFLVRMSEDHSLAAITGEPSSVLLNSFGASKAVFLEFGPMKFVEGDILLLCSDGLTSMLSEEEIENILRNHPEPLEEFLTRAKDRGGHDNISIVLIKFLSENTKFSLDDKSVANDSLT